jgi:hypothetical protein
MSGKQRSEVTGVMTGVQMTGVEGLQGQQQQRSYDSRGRGSGGSIQQILIPHCKENPIYVFLF